MISDFEQMTHARDHTNAVVRHVAAAKEHLEHAARHAGIVKAAGHHLAKVGHEVGAAISQNAQGKKHLDSLIGRPGWDGSSDYATAKSNSGTLAHHLKLAGEHHAELTDLVAAGKAKVAHAVVAHSALKEHLNKAETCASVASDAIARALEARDDDEKVSKASILSGADGQHFRWNFPVSIKKELSDGSLIVEGCASVADYLDSQGDVPDPAGLKKAMEEWAPFGNIRAQHDPKQAIGTIRQPIFGEISEELRPGWWMDKHPATGTDAAFIRAHIVDAAAVRKFKANIFSGFSVGGEINPGGFTTEEIVVDGVKKTIRRLMDFSFAEISAVDKPACDLALVNSVQIAKRGEEEMSAAEIQATVKREVDRVLAKIRKDQAVTHWGAEREGVKERQPQTRVTELTPPPPPSNVRRAIESMIPDIETIGNHLTQSSYLHPGSKPIGLAGMMTFQTIQILNGLRINTGGGASLGPEELAEALGQKFAIAPSDSGFTKFHKTYSTQRSNGHALTRVSGEFLKTSDGGLEETKNHMTVLGDALAAAMKAHPNDEHLAAAHKLHCEAMARFERGISNPDGPALDGSYHGTAAHGPYQGRDPDEAEKGSRVYAGFSKAASPSEDLEFRKACAAAYASPEIWTR